MTLNLSTSNNTKLMNVAMFVSLYSFFMICLFSQIRLYSSQKIDSVASQEIYILLPVWNLSEIEWGEYIHTYIHTYIYIYVYVYVYIYRRENSCLVQWMKMTSFNSLTFCIEVIFFELYILPIAAKLHKTPQKDATKVTMHTETKYEQLLIKNRTKMQTF